MVDNDVGGVGTGDEDLELAPGDSPEVRQMKLLRRDLRVDKEERAIFERRVNRRLRWQWALLVVLVLSTGTSLWNVQRQLDDDERDDAREAARDCATRRDGREGARIVLVDGGVTSAVAGAQAIVAVAGDRADPEVIGQYLKTVEDQARADLTKLVDRVLPPIVCE